MRLSHDQTVHSPQSHRNGGTVNLHERALAPTAEIMDRARNEFFAGTGFAADQDGETARNWRSGTSPSSPTVFSRHCHPVRLSAHQTARSFGSSPRPSTDRAPPLFALTFGARPTGKRGVGRSLLQKQTFQERSPSGEIHPLLRLQPACFRRIRRQSSSKTSVGW